MSNDNRKTITASIGIIETKKIKGLTTKDCTHYL